MYLGIASWCLHTHMCNCNIASLWSVKHLCHETCIGSYFETDTNHRLNPATFGTGLPRTEAAWGNIQVNGLHSIRRVYQGLQRMPFSRAFHITNVGTDVDQGISAMYHGSVSHIGAYNQELCSKHPVLQDGRQAMARSTRGSLPGRGLTGRDRPCGRLRLCSFKEQSVIGEDVIPKAKEQTSATYKYQCTQSKTPKHRFSSARQSQPCNSQF